MKLLRRRTPPPTEPEAPSTPGGGKGRPTPKRSEAQRRRSGPPQKPPQTRREAYRRTRDQGREDRAAARQGQRGGDERFQLARDRGPVRRLVRDLVDTRRNPAGLFLPAALLYFIGSVSGSPAGRALATLIWLGLIVIVVVDSVLLHRLIKRRVLERYPDTTEKMRSLTFYGVTRATMFRRWRQPRPAVDRGATI